MPSQQRKTRVLSSEYSEEELILFVCSLEVPQKSSSNSEVQREERYAKKGTNGFKERELPSGRCLEELQYS
jgi:hypothetical protein